MVILPEPVWSLALMALIVATSGLVVAVRWGRAVLDDADRYLTATSHLPNSTAVRRVSGWVTARAVRRTVRRALRSRGMGTVPGGKALERRVARVVPEVMDRAWFRAGWTVTHRVLHARAARARRGGAWRGGGVRGRGPVRSRPLAVAMLMLMLAAGGEVAGRVPRRSR